MSKVSYASVVGRLMYTMLCTRPNICFVVSLESGFQSNTRRSHQKAVKHIFRYLRGNNDMMLYYKSNDLKLEYIYMHLLPVIQMMLPQHQVIFFFQPTVLFHGPVKSSLALLSFLVVQPQKGYGSRDLLVLWLLYHMLRILYLCGWTEKPPWILQMIQNIKDQSTQILNTIM